VRRQRGAILKVREIIDVDQRGDRLAMLADGDRPWLSRASATSSPRCV
jgi:hypothetical protein